MTHLLERKLESEIAVNMERKQKGEQFRILDPAKLPEKPIKPDMQKLFIMIVGAGLAMSAAELFFFWNIWITLSSARKTSKRIWSCRCCVPFRRLSDRKSRILRRFEYASCAVFGFISFILFAGFAVLTQKGVAKRRSNCLEK